MGRLAVMGLVVGWVAVVVVVAAGLVDWTSDSVPHGLLLGAGCDGAAGYTTPVRDPKLSCTDT